MPCPFGGSSHTRMPSNSTQSGSSNVLTCAARSASLSRPPLAATASAMARARGRDNVDGHAVLRQRNRRCEHVGERQPAKALDRVDPRRRRARRRDAVHRRGVECGTRLPGGADGGEVERGRTAAAAVEPAHRLGFGVEEEAEGVAADAGHARLGHVERGRHCHACIGRVAASSEHAQADLAGQRLRRGRAAVRAEDRRAAGGEVHGAVVVARRCRRRRRWSGASSLSSAVVRRREVHVHTSRPRAIVHSADGGATPATAAPADGSRLRQHHAHLSPSR